MQEKKICQRCGYEWIPRRAAPVKCPLCQRYLLSKAEIINLRKSALKKQDGGEL